MIFYYFSTNLNVLNVVNGPKFNFIDIKKVQGSLKKKFKGK